MVWFTAPTNSKSKGPLARHRAPNCSHWFFRRCMNVCMNGYCSRWAGGAWHGGLCSQCMNLCVGGGTTADLCCKKFVPATPPTSLQTGTIWKRCGELISSSLLKPKVVDSEISLKHSRRYDSTSVIITALGGLNVLWGGARWKTFERYCDTGVVSVLEQPQHILLCTFFALQHHIEIISMLHCSIPMCVFYFRTCWLRLPVVEQEGANKPPDKWKSEVGVTAGRGREARRSSL